MMQIENENIDHKILATHFEDKYKNRRSAVVGMLELKKKWNDSKKGLWIVYVKAYNFDNNIQND